MNTLKLVGPASIGAGRSWPRVAGSISLTMRWMPYSTMQAPSASARYASTAARSPWPPGRQKGRIVVLPPAAADALAEAKSSTISMPGPEGCETWTWLSIPPGSTRRPVASTTSPAGPRSAPSAAMRPSRMPTSATTTSPATTRPPRITVS